MIWYSHVNEDNRVERELLLQGEYDQVVCVTGSGERALALMDAVPLRAFHAIDVNPDANYLLELKLSALKHLGARDYLGFCGLVEKRSRRYGEVTREVLDGLSPGCRNYWESRMGRLRAGVANCGHFEQFLARIRPMLTVILGKGFEECFVSSYDSYQKFPFRRWKFLLGLFSQRWVYFLMGNRDPAFVAPDAEPVSISRALQRTLEEGLVDASFMFHLVFRGDLNAMPLDQLPPSLRSEVLDAIQIKLRDPEFLIEFHDGDIRTIVSGWTVKDLSRTFFSISDILSFSDFDYLFEFLDLLKGEKISVVFRNFLRHGLSREQIKTLQTRFKQVTDVSGMDQTRMYSVYQVHI